MNLLSVVGIGVVAAILAVIVRQTRPEQAMLIGLGTGCVIFGFAFSQIRELLTWWRTLANEYGFLNSYLSPMIRILGVSYLTQFASQTCRDVGEGAIAMKLDFAGKIVILALTTPVLQMVLELIKSIL